MKKLLSMALISNFIILSSCSKFELIAGSYEKGLVNAVATNAKFNKPTKMAVDEKTGDLYVLDSLNDSVMIKKLSISGLVSNYLEAKDIDTNSKSNKYTFSDLKANKDFLYFSMNYNLYKINLRISNSKAERIYFNGDLVVNKKESSTVETKDEDQWLKITFDEYDNLIVAGVHNSIPSVRLIASDNIKELHFNNISETKYTFYNNPNDLTSSETLDYNYRLKNLTVLFFSPGIFYRSYIFETKTDINTDNIIKESEISDISTSTTSLVSDRSGNRYLLSYDKKALLKFNINNIYETVSNLNGIVDIPYDATDRSAPRLEGANLAIDNSRKIIYLSVSVNNSSRIFKLNLT